MDFLVCLAWVFSNHLRFSPLEEQMAQENTSVSTQVLMLKRKLRWCQVTSDTEITALIVCPWQTGLTAEMSTPPWMHGHLSCLSVIQPPLYWVWWVRSVIGKVKPKPCLNWRHLVQHSLVILLRGPAVLMNVSLLYLPPPLSIKSDNLII